MTDANATTAVADTGNTTGDAGQVAAAPVAAAAATDPAATATTDPAAAAPEAGAPEDMSKVSHDELVKRVNGLRAKLSERGTVPESPDGYQIALSGELEPYSAKLAEDPVFADMRKAFQANGVTDKQAQGIVQHVMDGLMKGGHLEPPFDPAREMELLFPNEAPEARKSLTKAAISDNTAFLQALKAEGLSDRAIDLALSMQDRAGGVELVKFMAGIGRQKGPMPSGAIPTAVTKEAVDARFFDARNDPASPKFERAFALETQRLVKLLHPDSA